VTALSYGPELSRALEEIFAGQLRCLLDPTRQELLVEVVALVDMEVAGALVLGLDGGEWAQRRAVEESHLDVLREAMEVEEPALALDTIEGRVPPHGLAHVGHGAHDECVEAAPDVAFPARHGCDVSLDRGVAVGLRDLRVTACEEDRLLSGCLRGRGHLGVGSFGFLRHDLIPLSKVLVGGFMPMLFGASANLPTKYFTVIR